MVPSSSSSSSSTVIIFDWDDTICPSSFVDQCQIDSISDLPLHVSLALIVFFHDFPIQFKLSIDSSYKFSEFYESHVMQQKHSIKI